MKAKPKSIEKLKSGRLGEFRLIDSSLINYSGRITVTKYYNRNKEEVSK